MSYRQKETFGYDLLKSNRDLRKVSKWLIERTGVANKVVGKQRHDIEDSDGTTYEHKADLQAHKTKNVCFEVSRNEKVCWLYTCDADYLVVTSSEHIRIFRWKGHLQDYLLFHMNGRYRDMFKWGGDDDAVKLLLVPAWRLRSFLEWEEPWDNSK